MSRTPNERRIAALPPDLQECIRSLSTRIRALRDDLIANAISDDARWLLRGLSEDLHALDLAMGDDRKARARAAIREARAKIGGGA